MPFLNRDWWACPFCDKGQIEVLVRPASYRESKQSGGKGGRATVRRKVRQDVTVLTPNCPACGKSREEIEKGFS